MKQFFTFKIYNYKIIFLFLFILLSNKLTFAHATIVGLEDMSGKETALLYIKLGFQHILPLGLDHILFVLSLFLLNPKLKPVLLQATTFTLAHTVTLGLTMFNIIQPPTSIVEPLISLSIMYVAFENIISPSLKPARIGVVFLFGLIHGMGFASVLSELGLPENSYLTSLLMFNLGVEIGQMAVIFAAYILLAKWFGDKYYYRNRMVIPLSVIIIIIAGYWTIERII